MTFPSFGGAFDAAVAGAGHAGLEAALACARSGLRTILITQTLDSAARMSCNPSIGGIAKGNIVREIDALGGEMARLIDRSMLQFRMLNMSKGPAVQAPRAQADKFRYAALARLVLEREPNLALLQDTAVSIETAPIPASPRRAVAALITERGRRIPCLACVLTTGTFLGGTIFIGAWDAPQGRLGESAAFGLTASLRALGIRTGRLKTGTPPRVLKKTIDFSRLTPQHGDFPIIPFSFTDETADCPQLPCAITYTNAETHRIIRENLSRSPLYGGKIRGAGPRYCPSIEDKVVRFAERERHQIFAEPEGERSGEIYLNGLSSSLPEDVQDRIVRTLPGFENAVISRPAYAVEYDYLDPVQLFPSLETKAAAGLFTAGQINGTSGYEEAAGQGIIAGINAARYAKARAAGGAGAAYEPLILRRDEAYIGVMIDDLVTKGTAEPYRMFTARAEYRLRLRHATADERLTEHGFRAGLQSRERLEAVERKAAAKAEIRALLDAGGGGENPGYPPALWNEALIDRKYGHYIEKQDRRIEKLKRMESARIPADFDYAGVSGLSAESKQKLEAVRPLTLGQAGRISGIRASDIMLLMVYLR